MAAGASAHEEVPATGADRGLVRGLSLTAATSVSLGTVIGSGIFIGSNRVAQGVDSAWWLFAIWIGAGAASLLGALVYAEFGASMPRSGSDYVYIKRSISPYWGFLSGWATLAVNVPASIAAISLAFASQVETLKPGAHGVLVTEGFAVKFTAVGLILIFTVVNYFGVRLGGNTQAFLTALKLFLIGILIVIGLSGLLGDPSQAGPIFTERRAAVQGGLAIALVGALWATDGWAGVTRVAGEVKNPQRNLPRALVTSTIIVTGVYVLLNLAYLAALGLDGMAGTGDPVADRLLASRAAEAAVGAPGRTFVAILIMISILGGLNGLTLGGPRVYFAMARDALFFRPIERVHPRHHTPYVSIFFQNGIAIVLAIFFSFELLTAYVVMAAWISYSLASVGLIMLRRKEPGLPRPYLVPMYPWIPLLFAAISIGFVIYLVGDAVWLAITGTPSTLIYLGLNILALATSVPLYLYFRARNRRASEGAGPGGPSPATTQT